MTAATAETEQQTEMVTFNSRSENQILTRRPPRNEINEFGQKTVVTEEEWFDRMRAREEDTGESFDDTPWRVEFANHIFETDHPKLLRWLRQHDKLGVDAPGGFWEVPPTEDELRPTPADQYRAIAQAQAIKDQTASLDALADILLDEKETHNRPAIIASAEAALSVRAEEPSESEADAGETGNGDPESTAKP